MQYSIAFFFSFRSFVSGVGLLLVHIFTELVRTKVYCLHLFYVVSCAQFNIVHEVRHGGEVCGVEFKRSNNDPIV